MSNCCRALLLAGLAAAFVSAADTTDVYFDDFSGSSGTYLGGQAPDVSPGSETWVAFTISSTPNWMADGTIVSNTVSQHRGAFLPFVPQSGHVYVLSLDPNPVEDWFALGFTETNLANKAFSDSTLGASPWIHLNGTRTSASRAYVGPGNTDYTEFSSPTGMVSMALVLDTQNSQWTVKWFCNGFNVRQYTFDENPDISYVGFGRFGFAEGSVDNFRLTQYTSEWIYSDDFSGSSGTYLSGQSPDIRPGSETWDAFTVGTAWMADGSIVSNTVSQHRDAFLPFVPEEGRVYKLSLDVNPTNDWFALGFSGTNVANLAFSDSSLGASPWMNHKGDREVDSRAFVGPGSADYTEFESATGVVALAVVLDTRYAQWNAEWFCNGERVGAQTFDENPDIHYVGFGRYGVAEGTVHHFGLAEIFQLGTPRVYIEMVAEDLVPVEPTNQIPLIIHRMGSMPPANVARNQRGVYKDETLLDPGTTRTEELMFCREAGAVAVMQDYSASQIASEAGETGVKAVGMVNMSPLSLANNNASEDDPESVADYCLTRLELEETYPGKMYGQDGRPFLWVFSASSVSANLFDDVRPYLTAAGYNPFIFFHAQNMTQSEVDDYMDTFDGALVWGGGYDETREMIEMVLQSRDSIEQATGVKKKVVLTTKSGNWRPEKGNLIAPHGTAELRKIINLAYQYNVDALHIESWNDYSENHHIQPSVNNSTVRSDLCRFYGNYTSGQRETVTVYSDTFDGFSSEFLSGTVPDEGVGEYAWEAFTIGTAWMADGSIVSNTVSQHRDAFLPLNVESGNIYTLSLDVNPTLDWFALGFTETNLANKAFTDASLGASPWMSQPGVRTSYARAYVGPGLNDYETITSDSGSVELKIVLDTTEDLWSAEWFYNGTSVRSYTYATNPVINYVGFGRFGFGQGTVDNFKLTKPAFESPGLYVSHRREILLGEHFECEVFSLPVQAPTNRMVSLVVRDQDGGVVYESGSWTLGRQDAKVRTFQIPTTSMSAGDVLSPRLKINGVETASETHCVVAAGRLRYPYELHMSMAKALHPTSVQFEMDGYSPGDVFQSLESRQATVSVVSPKKIARVEILKNYDIVFCREFDQTMTNQSPSGSYQVAEFRWGVVASGYGEEMDFRGTNTISGGTILDAVTARKSTPANPVTSTHAVWGYNPTQVGQDALLVAFDGDTGTVFNISMPLQGFSASIPWSDVVESGFMEYSIHPYANLIVRPIPGPFGAAGSLGIYSNSFTVELPTLDDRPWNVYFLRVIAEDGSIYRSMPIQVFADSSDGIAACIWNTQSNAAVQVSVPVSQVGVDVDWTFEGENSRIVSDVNGLGFDMELGGIYDGDGRYASNQVPSYAEGEAGGSTALEFDGIDDVAFIRPELIPSGSWSMDLWIKPLNLTNSTDQMIFKVTESLFLMLQPDGTLSAWFGDRTANTTLYGQTQLSSQWYHITFAYDLSTAALFIDGVREASVDVCGLRDRIVGRTYLGADVPADQLATPVRPFKGLVDRMKISTDVSALYTSEVEFNAVACSTVSGAALPAYQNWALAAGLTAGVNDGPDQDPDQDGRSNLEEFAFDEDPLFALDEGKRRVAAYADNGSVVLMLTVPVRQEASFAGLPELSADTETICYRISGTTDLVDGVPLTVQETTPVALDLPELSAGWEYRAFQISSEDLPSGFMSVTVEEQ